MPEFLSKAMYERRNVKVFTTNGYQMRGQILEIDEEFGSILLDIEGEKHLVFMNAISTIV